MSTEHKAPNAEKNWERRGNRGGGRTRKRTRRKRRGGGEENSSFVIHSCVNASSGNPECFFLNFPN